jgi:hypothetical protein
VSGFDAEQEAARLEALLAEERPGPAMEAWRHDGRRAGGGLRNALAGLTVAAAAGAIAVAVVLPSRGHSVRNAGPPTTAATAAADQPYADVVSCHPAGTGTTDPVSGAAAAMQYLVSAPGGASTCVGLPGMTPAFAVPLLLRDGAVIAPTQVNVLISPRGDSTATLPPAGLRVRLTASGASGAVTWQCFGQQHATATGGAPLTCPSGSTGLHVNFPDCWDGLLTGVDDTPHLRLSSAGTCPPGFRHLVAVSIRVDYPVQSRGPIGAPATGAFTTSEGAYSVSWLNSWNATDGAAVGSLPWFEAHCLAHPVVAPDCRAL